MSSDETWVPVWDPFVRISHWSLVVAFFIAYLTEDDLMTLHAWAGYVVGVLVVLRVLWGFVGPKHARFSDFLYRPSEVLAYLRDLFSLSGKRYLGHSPAGGAMVIVLLAGLMVTVWSGMEALAVDRGEGPLARSGGETLMLTPAWANDDEKTGYDLNSAVENRGGSKFWEEFHEVLASLALALVLLHIGGVFLASYVHRENLIRAMVTGRKRRDGGWL